MATRRELRGLEAFISRTKLQVSGLSEIHDALANLAEGVGHQRARDVLVKVGSRIVRRAKPLTPDDPETQGALRESVRLHSALISAGKTPKTISMTVMAGGEPLEKRMKGHLYRAWALVQHEDTTLRHPNGGQAKFIEQPFLEEAPKVPGEVLDALVEAAED